MRNREVLVLILTSNHVDVNKRLKAPTGSAKWFGSTYMRSQRKQAKLL